jgi:integrase
LKRIGKNDWEIRWREDVVDVDGNVRRIRHKETLRQKTIAQARKVLDMHLSEANSQQRRCGVNLTVANFVKTEFRPNAPLRLRKSSMRIYDSNLDRHILPALGEVPIQDISRAQIEACLSGLQRKGYAVSTLRNVRATISTVLESAVSDRYIADNPAHGIRLRESDSPREPRYYRAPEIRRLLQHLEEPCRSVVLVAVSTGLRIGEILALRWKRIDLPDGTIEVAETYSSGEFGPPKTRSSRRTIPISASLAGIFKRLRPQNCEAEQLVFATLKGTPLNPKNLYNRQLAPACDSIGLPRVSWHSFRHTHATLLHEAGGSLKTAQALLGHSDLETTLGVYTHADPDAQRRAVERVAGVLDPVGPESRFESARRERVN